MIPGGSSNASPSRIADVAAICIRLGSAGVTLAETYASSARSTRAAERLRTSCWLPCTSRLSSRAFPFAAGYSATRKLSGAFGSSTRRSGKSRSRTWAVSSELYRMPTLTSPKA